MEQYSSIPVRITNRLKRPRPTLATFFNNGCGYGYTIRGFIRSQHLFNTLSPKWQQRVREVYDTYGPDVDPVKFDQVIGLFTNIQNYSVTCEQDVTEYTKVVVPPPGLVWTRPS